MTFGLKDGKWPTPDDPLFVDFQGKEISKVKVNQSFFGRDSVQFEGHRVKLPSSADWRAKNNVVEFEFKNTYVDNSAGLHFYRDPKDQKVYIYSHLEPFFCHRFIPCFD